jgi:hypothetical protein
MINSKEISDIIRLQSHQVNTILETIYVGFTTQTTQINILFSSIEKLNSIFSDFHILTKIENDITKSELYKFNNITNILNCNLIKQTFSSADYSIKNKNFPNILPYNKNLIYAIYYSLKLFFYLKYKPFIECVTIGNEFIIKIGSQTFNEENKNIKVGNFRQDYYLLYKNLINFIINKISYFSSVENTINGFEIVICSKPKLIYDLANCNLFLINKTIRNINSIKTFCNKYDISLIHISSISDLKNISQNKLHNFIIHLTYNNATFIKFETDYENKLYKNFHNIKQVMPTSIIKRYDSELDILQAINVLLEN